MRKLPWWPRRTNRKSSWEGRAQASWFPRCSGTARARCHCSARTCCSGSWGDLHSTISGGKWDCCVTYLVFITPRVSPTCLSKVELDFRTTVLISGRKRKVEFECGKGQKKAVRINTWFRMGCYCLVLSSTVSVKGFYACIYWKSGDLVRCHHSGTTDKEG